MGAISPDLLLPSRRRNTGGTFHAFPSVASLLKGTDEPHWSSLSRCLPPGQQGKDTSGTAIGEKE